ncbi:MAG: hypothetical protein GX218_05875 [Clostridiaceae bacterium]|jgi:hypothetical protein|nr:hypothetical protein [Clostridiaceae bacterium]
MKKILFVLLFLMMALILAIEVMGFVRLNQPDTQEEGILESISDIILAESDNMAEATIRDVIRSVVVDAQASPITSTMVVSHKIPFNSQDLVFFIRPNQIIRQGERLAAKNEKEYRSSVTGRVDRIIQNKRSTQINIVDYDQMFINARLPQQNSDRVDLGFPVVVRYNDRFLEGKISQIDMQVVEGEVGIQIVCMDDDLQIRPGSKLQIILIEDQIKGVVAIPAEALIKSQSSLNYVRLIRRDAGHSVETTPVQIGLVGDQYVQIISGISIGDWVLLP